jgi:mannose-6-phosphate isomerase-like protein (cupin superfamily)
MEMTMSTFDQYVRGSLHEKLDAAPCPVVSRTDKDGWFNAIPGETLKIRIPGSATGGAYAILESVVEPGYGPPLHFHREDEIFEVLEGVMTFQVVDGRFEASPGTIVSVPAGVHHAWFNFGSAPVRMIVTFAPGGIEALFPQLGGMAPADIAKLAERYGTVIVGAPLGG